jgi:Niemann-Pick C1 protein
MRWRQAALLGTVCLAAKVWSAEGELTKKHEAGLCAIRGSCGSDGLFGPKLPCPDNGPAEKPEPEVRDKLVEICGDSWSDTKICCESDQVGVMSATFVFIANLRSSIPSRPT